MTPLTIQLPAGDALAPLYHRYPRQTQPRGAYLEIDPRAETAQWDWDGEISGAVPEAVWHHRVLRVPCDASLSRATLATLSEELRPLVARVIAGYDERWDGADRRGHLDDDATGALGDLHLRLEDASPDEQVPVWDAEEWLYDAHASLVAGVRQRITAGDTREAAIATCAATLAEETETQQIQLDGDVADVLTRWLDAADGDATGEG